MAEATASVLVVEESFVDAPHGRLEREGCRALVAKDDAEALDLLGVIRPDLVLLDVMLRRISGPDVCRQIRGCRSAVPIATVSARTSEPDTVVGLEDARRPRQAPTSSGRGRPLGADPDQYRAGLGYRFETSSRRPKAGES